MVVHAKLITYREDFGGYIVYLFEIIGGQLPYDKYIMCTRFPNWDCMTLKIGDVGYLKYREVIAGEDKWYDINSGQLIPYKYTGVHFLDFIPEKEEKDCLIL